MSLISYASTALKAISVPFGNTPEVADDFFKFHGGEPEGKMEMKLSRSRTELYLEVICQEPAEIHAQNTNNDWSIFEKGDRLEIFFGALVPEPWLMQFAIGAGGGKADNRSLDDQWTAEVETGANFWKAKAVFPLSIFHLNNLSVYFNVCRYAEARKEFSCWTNLARGFHEVENYGLFLLDDYSKVYFAETGIYPEKELTRTEFETEMEKLRVPAHKIQHGPWITNPTQTEMTVSFGSAGNCGAFLEYRQKGSEEWTRLAFDRKNAILIRNRRIHIRHLQDLKPGTDYQYRVITLHPITMQENISEIYEFRTLETERKTFTFTAFSDLHSNTGRVRKLLEKDALKKSDFLINIGDLLSSACGDDSFYNGFLDLEADWCKETGKPLVFIRGNHEQIGSFAGLYQELLPHHSGKTYYSFRQGDTLFIALDAGNDKPDDEAGIHKNQAMIQEQQEWLKELSQTEEYRNAKWRIVLIHMPVYKRRYDSDMAYSMIRLIPETDLILSGHLHKYFTVEPETGVCFFKQENRTSISEDKLPTLTIANDTDTLLQVDVTETHLTVRAIDTNGEVIDCRKVEAKK